MENPSARFLDSQRHGAGNLAALHVLLVVVVAAFLMLSMTSPDNFFLAGTAILLLGAGFAGWAFPWTFFGIAVGTLIFSPENFIQFEIQGVEVRSLHRALILVAFCATVLRHGISRSFNAPLMAAVATFFTSLFLSDLHPKLTLFQVVKSLFGFAVLFLFINVNYSPRVIPRYVRMIGLLPLVSVAAGAVAQAIQLDSIWGTWKLLPTEYTGAPRLNGINISSFLAYFAFTAFVVNIYELLDSKKNWLLGLAGINLVILILTGTRAPTVAAMIVALSVLIFARGDALRISSKLTIALAGALVIGGVLVLWWPAIEARVLRGLGGNTVNLSGRDIIWEYFLQAFWVNPWFGRGLGTGAVLLIGELKVTTAAHNEYLRLLTDVGVVGLLLFIAGIFLWVRGEMRFLNRAERLLILSTFLGLALYSFTDNTLSNPPSLIAFFALSLIFARARHREAYLRRLRAAAQAPSGRYPRLAAGPSRPAPRPG